MSEPVKAVGAGSETTAEIEDVLTSIRKLVSQDAKAARSRAGGSALVLTQDARVDDALAAGDVDEAGDRVAQDEGAERHAEAARVVRTELERALAELESAMGIPADDTSSSHGAEDGEAVTDDLDWDAPVGRAMAGPPPISSEPEFEETLKRTMLDPATKPKSALDRLRLVSSEAEQLEEPFEDAYGSARPMRPAEIDIADAVDEGDEPGADTVAPVEDVVEEPALETAPLEAEGARGALADAMEGPIEPEMVPDAVAEAPEDAFRLPPSVGEDTHDDPYQSFDGDSAADEFEASLKRDLSYDDAALRELVAEIVREELQGALGEKITRNVRRLVRREINRALAGQDLI